MWKHPITQSHLPSLVSNTDSGTYLRKYEAIKKHTQNVLPDVSAKGIAHKQDFLLLAAKKYP